MHKAQKPLRSSRYSNGQKHFRICDIYRMGCDTIKLRIREYKTGFDSTILISSENTNLTSNSIAKLLDQTRSKSNIEEPDVQTSYEKALQVSRMSLVVSLVMFISVDYVVRE